MARGKVKLAFISGAAKRKATYQKRRKGLLNKVRELSTLCGINICAIMFGLDESEPVVWPSSLGVERMISQFKNKTRLEQTSRMFDQEAFLRDRITKVEKKLGQQIIENHEKEITELLYRAMLLGKSELENLSLQHLDELERKGEQHLREINRRMEAMRIVDGQGLLAVPPPTPPLANNNRLVVENKEVREIGN